MRRTIKRNVLGARHTHNSGVPMNKNYYLLIAGGVDTKGIVFNLTKVLNDFAFNIEDSSMVMLRRTFSVIVLLSHDRSRLPDTFESQLRAFGDRFGMAVDFRKITQKEMKEYGGSGKRYMISISGADRPGIVRSITETIVRKGGNVIDLETKSSQRTTPPAYYMLLEVDLPSRVSEAVFRQALVRSGKKLGVHVSVQRVVDEIL
jgi:glycine cleavage system transcriptional repressor